MGGTEQSIAIFWLSRILIEAKYLYGNKIVDAEFNATSAILQTPSFTVS
jgi:hypothetical protein